MKGGLSAILATADGDESGTCVSESSLVWLCCLFLCLTFDLCCYRAAAATFLQVEQKLQTARGGGAALTAVSVFVCFGNMSSKEALK